MEENLFNIFKTYIMSQKYEFHPEEFKVIREKLNLEDNIYKIDIFNQIEFFEEKDAELFSEVVTYILGQTIIRSRPENIDDDNITTWKHICKINDSFVSCVEDVHFGTYDEIYEVFEKEVTIITYGDDGGWIFDDDVYIVN